MTPRVSKQLAKILSKPSKQGVKIVVSYDRLDDPKPGMVASVLVDGLSKDLIAKLKALEAGDEVVIVKTETAPNKDGKTFFIISDIEDKETFVPKEKKLFQKAGGYQKSSYDKLGATVGMIFKDAYQDARDEGDTSQNNVQAHAIRIAKLVVVVDELVRPILENKESSDEVKPVSKKLVEEVKQATQDFEDEWAGDIDMSVFE